MGNYNWFSSIRKGTIGLIVPVVLGTFLRAGYGQDITFCGYVKDSITGEVLIGAPVRIRDYQVGTVTNNYGFFSLSVATGKCVVLSSNGYRSKEFQPAASDTCITLYLSSVVTINEVVVTGYKESRALSGVISLPLNTVKSIPLIAGEKDILKSFQTLPGVQGGVEGTSSMHVRGGSPDQNLVLIDGVPVYNVNHLFGIFSVFNTDAINSAVMYKGYMPAKFGGRIASVLDITMKEGNHEKFGGNFSLGLISSKAMLNGNQKNDKTTWLIAARRTYFDILSRPFIKGFADGAVAGYYFYDVNAKINHCFNHKHRVYLSFYAGKDKYYARYKTQGSGDDDGISRKENSDDAFGWANITTAFRWNWLMHLKTFTNLTLTFSTFKLSSHRFYSQELSNAGETLKSEYSIGSSSGIRDFSFRWDIESEPVHFLRIESGVSAGNQWFRPDSKGSSIGNSDYLITIDTTAQAPFIHTTDVACYLDTKTTLSESLILNAGVRTGFFFVEGKAYYGAEPRVHLNWFAKGNLKFSLAWNRANQYFHLLTRSNLGLPTDVWVPSTRIINPVRSDQFSFSIEKRLKQSLFFTSEIFWKKMENLAEFREGATYLYDSRNWQSAIEQGQGVAYGLEVLAEKKAGMLTGWLSYTLSRSERKFPAINRGLTYPYKYDRRHYFTVVAMVKPKKNIEIAATWLLSSGFRLSLVTENYRSAIYDYTRLFPETGYYSLVEQTGAKNRYKTPPFHRLDIGINFHKQKKKYSRIWSVGVYNVYFRKNPLYVDYSADGFYMVSVVPFLPWFSYTIQF